MQKGAVVMLCALIMLGYFSSCTTKNEILEEDCLCFCEKFVHDELASIEGKWKLIYSKSSYAYVIEDYQCDDFSQYNIVYEFKTNNVLMISAETENPKMMYPEMGEHFYSIVERESLWGRDIRLEIDDSHYYWFKYSPKELLLDDRPIDGEALYFTKIN